MIRALPNDGSGHAAHISKAPSPRSRSAKKIESPARDKKIFNKRLPVNYFLESATFPRISFLNTNPIRLRRLAD
jgi:hypothetical protein